MEINQLLANSSNYTVGNRTSKDIKYIVVHYTANNGDTAQSNSKYFQSPNRNASAHYFVDENNVYQSVLDKDKAWHCGTETGVYYSDCRNSTSIGIELCSRKDNNGKYYFKDETVNNAIKLVKSLMNKYNVNVDNVIRHYDVTHKNCPAPFVETPVNWTNFKNKLIEIEMEDDEVVDTTKIEVNGKDYIVNRILKDGKNYVELASFEKTGIEVGYNNKTKIPTLDTIPTSKTNIKINNEIKNVDRVLKNGTNYVKIRDLESKNITISNEGSTPIVTTK